MAPKWLPVLLCARGFALVDVGRNDSKLGVKSTENGASYNHTASDKKRKVISDKVIVVSDSRSHVTALPVSPLFSSTPPITWDGSVVILQL